MHLENFTDSINQLLPEPHASLLAGMLFGVRRSMPAEFYADLITTGTLHVIALSGMNVSIIIRVLFDTAGMFFGRIAGVIVTLAGIVGFVNLVGPSPTIVRASIMGSLTVLAVLIGRKDIPLLSLFLAAGAMILFSPGVISDISFQLSFAATLGIVLFNNTNSVVGIALQDTATPKAASIKRRFLRGPALRIWTELAGIIKNDLRVTLSAQLCTVPIIFYYFHRVSLISPIANVATGWLVAPITIMGFVMVALSALWRPLGDIAAFLIWPLLTLFIEIVYLLSGVPMASVEL